MKYIEDFPKFFVEFFFKDIFSILEFPQLLIPSIFPTWLSLHCPFHRFKGIDLISLPTNRRYHQMFKGKRLNLIIPFRFGNSSGIWLEKTWILEELSLLVRNFKGVAIFFQQDEIFQFFYRNLADLLFLLLFVLHQNIFYNHFWTYLGVPWSAQKVEKSLLRRLMKIQEAKNNTHHHEPTNQKRRKRNGCIYRSHKYLLKLHCNFFYLFFYSKKDPKRTIDKLKCHIIYIILLKYERSLTALFGIPSSISKSSSLTAYKSNEKKGGKSKQHPLNERLKFSRVWLNLFGKEKLRSPTQNRNRNRDEKFPFVHN